MQQEAKTYLQWLPAASMLVILISGAIGSQYELTNLARADEAIRSQLDRHILNVNNTIKKHDKLDDKRERNVAEAIKKLQLDTVMQARIEERQKVLQRDGDRREKKLNLIINKLTNMQKGDLL